MNIVVENQPESISKISVTVPSDIVAKEHKQLINGFKNQAKIQGFRPGKAPESLVAKKFEKEIKEELSQRLISQGVEQAIKEKELDILRFNAPDTLDWKDNGDFHIEITCITSPEFELPEYKGITIESASDEVTDEELDTSLKGLQKNLAQFDPSEKTQLEEGLCAIIDYSGSIEGKSIEEAIGKDIPFLTGSEGYWLHINDDKNTMLPELAKAIIGLKVGETKEVQVTLSDEFAVEEARGKVVDFKVELKDIQEEHIPELDDSLAKKTLGEEATIQELKDKMKEYLQGDKKAKVFQQKSDKIVKQLLDKIEIDLPESLVKEETQNIANETIQQGYQYGLDEAAIKEQQEQILANASEQAKDRLKTSFVLQKIAKVEKIEVTQEEMMGQLQQEAQATQKDLGELIKEYQQSQRLESLRYRMGIDKTLAFLIEQAKITEIQPKVEETVEA